MPRATESSKKSFWTASLFLAVLTLTAFSGALHHPFINYDDESYIADNRLLTQQPLSWKGIEKAMTATQVLILRRRY